MSAEQVAREHYSERKALGESLSRLVRRLWSGIDPGDLDGAWARAVPTLTLGLIGAQVIAARRAGDYVRDTLTEQGAAADAVAEVVPDAFVGAASDGRPLDTLLRNPITVVKAGIAGGATLEQAMAAGYANLDMLVRTQFADVGRAADQVALVAHPEAEGFTRMLVGRSCSRCIVLAGRWYRWNADFDRHPRCDCTGVPGRSPVGGFQADPRRAFDEMTRAEQDKTFTIAGAQAIREGADIGRVVNARRGMATAGETRTRTRADGLIVNERIRRQTTTRVAGRDVFTTTEAAGRRVRLMPEQIYREAAGDRAEAVRLLRLHGYLTGAPRAARVVPPRAPEMQLPAAPRIPTQRAPEPAAPAAVKSLGDRVKAGIASRQMLSGGQNAKTELLTLADGSRVVFKKARAIEGTPARAQQDAEELVPLVLKAAGLRGPEIYRPTANQLYMEHFDGTLATKRRSLGHRVDPAAYDADQGLLLGLVDQVTDNYDRNTGNWLIGDRGEVLPIDHGFAFTFHGSSQPGTPMQATNQPASAFHGAYPRLREWVDNDLSPADVATFRRRLEGLRGEFERLGRPDWHDKMLARLDALGRHARGTKVRIR